MNQLTEKYRLVFNSPIGQEVLSDILTMTHFGNTLNSANPQQIGEYNIGVAILAKMGIFAHDTKSDVLKSLMSVTPQTAEIIKK